MKTNMILKVPALLVTSVVAVLLFSLQTIKAEEQTPDFEGILIYSNNVAGETEPCG